VLNVNGDPHPWRDGLTVADVLREKSFTFPMKVISVNKVLVAKSSYASHLLRDGDEVEVVHLTGGG
jgi:sulfur carrier protein